MGRAIWATAVACAAVFGLAACGGDNTEASRKADFANAVRGYLEQAPDVRASLRQRGRVLSVVCDSPQRYPGGQLVGCDIDFSTSGSERWFVVAGDSFYVLPCPRRNGLVRSLVGSVCKGGI